MEPARGEARGRWGTAIALLIAVMALAVFDVFPLVALPLAVLLVGLPTGRHWKWLVAGAVIWTLAVVLPSGSLGELSRGWSLLLASAFLLSTLVRPRWGVLPRALLAITVALATSALWLGATRAWGGVDWAVQEHYRTIVTLFVQQFGAKVSDPARLAAVRTALEEGTRVQWLLFPAKLALQSLAALALAAWWVGRLGRQEGEGFVLRPLREFRFNDQLVWVLIAGLVLVLLPLGPVARRAGYNILVFMGTLYALRGVGVWLFLSGGRLPVLSLFVGVLVVTLLTPLLFVLTPLVLSAALLVGLGDTWLDVRRRATLAPRA